MKDKLQRWNFNHKNICQLTIKGKSRTFWFKRPGYEKKWEDKRYCGC